MRTIIFTTVTTILLCLCCFPGNVTSTSVETLDFKTIMGEWVRTDGGYIVDVRKILPDGTVEAAYFNPSQINVAEARVSMRKGLIKLHIKLKDKGYPGSTYTLYYYKEKDAMAGFYYQAALDRTFEVVFLRKK